MENKKEDIRLFPPVEEAFFLDRPTIEGVSFLEMVNDAFVAHRNRPGASLVPRFLSCEIKCYVEGPARKIPELRAVGCLMSGFLLKICLGEVKICFAPEHLISW